MAGKRSETFFKQHTNRGFCAYTTLDDIPGVGMGHKRQRTGTILSETIWLCFCVEWTYSSEHDQSGRKYYVPYRRIHCFPTAATRRRTCSWANESTSGKASQCIRPHQCVLYGAPAFTCNHGFALNGS